MPSHAADADTKAFSDLFICFSAHKKFYDFFISRSSFDRTILRFTRFKYDQKLTSAVNIV